MVDKKTKSYQYAGFWRRFIAISLDSFILGLITSAFSGMFFRGSFRNGNPDFSFSYVPGALISFAYAAFFWIQHGGQTIGKKLMGIKIVRQDAKPIDLTTAITRYIGYLISGAVFCLGYISAAFNPKKLAWHDRLAKTYVVVVGKSNKLLSTIAIVLVVIFALIATIGIATGLFVAKKAVDTIKPEHLEQGIEQLERLNQNLEKYKDIDGFNTQDLEDIQDALDQSDTI